MKKRIFALGFALVFLVAALAGCGSSSESTETESSEAAAEIPEEAYDDVIAYLTDGAISAEDVVYTVNGIDITAQDYFYWLTYEAYVYSYSYYSSYYTYPDMTEEMSDGTTWAEYMEVEAYNYSTMYALVYAKAIEAGITLSDEYQAAYDAYIPDSITSLGESAWDTAVAAGTVSEDDYTDEEKAAWIQEHGEEEMELYLMYYSNTREGLEEIYLYNYYYQQYQAELFDVTGDMYPTDEELAQYIADNEIYNCRYILFGDSAGDMTDDELTEYYNEALACYEELSALSGTELDSAISEYAENNSDGNTSGELAFSNESTVLEDFLEVLSTLEVGQIGMSGETEDGYYVIIRDEAAYDTELADSLTVIEHYASDGFSEIVNEWIDSMEVTDTGVLESFDVNAFFTNLESLRELL